MFGFNQIFTFEKKKRRIGSETLCSLKRQRLKTRFKMVLHVASAVARRRVASMASQQIQRRNMGSGPKPEWTGIDKTVRDIFPEDWQRT